MEKTNSILLKLAVDKEAAANASAFLKRFLTETNTVQQGSARQAQALTRRMAADELRDKTRLQEYLRREYIKTEEIEQKAAARVATTVAKGTRIRLAAADAEIRARNKATTSAEREYDNEAKAAEKSLSAQAKAAEKSLSAQAKAYQTFVRERARADERYQSLRLHLYQRGASSLQSVGQSLTNNVSVPLKQGVVYALKVAVDSDTAFNEVKRFVSGTDKEIAALKKDLEGLALDPKVGQSFVELSKIASFGGQLGIAQKDMKEFVRQVAYLGQAGDLSGEMAATGIAKITTALNIPLTELPHISSALAEMGNVGSSTLREILSISQRFAPVAKQVGLTVPQIFAVSNAVASMGQNAEAGGTALQKAFSKMQMAVIAGGEPLKVYAHIAGTTTKQFAEAFQKDALGAMVLFLRGLDQLPKKSGDAQKALLELGIKEVRLKTALLNLASGHQFLEEATKRATKAYEGKNVAEDKARIASESLARQQQHLMNQVDAVARELGISLIPALKSLLTATKPLQDEVKHLADAYHALSPEAQEAWAKVALGAVALGPALNVLGTLGKGVLGLRTTYILLKEGGRSGSRCTGFEVCRCCGCDRGRHWRQGFVRGGPRYTLRCCRRGDRL